MNRSPIDRAARRLWWRSAVAVLTFVLMILTLLWRNWIEVFGVDPDHGDGSVELAVVAVLALVCVVSTTLAAAAWRSLRTV